MGITASAAHACSSPRTSKTRDLHKTGLAFWPAHVHNGEAQYAVIGKTGNQLLRAAVYLAHIKS